MDIRRFQKRVDGNQLAIPANEPNAGASRFSVLRQYFRRRFAPMQRTMGIIAYLIISYGGTYAHLKERLGTTIAPSQERNLFLELGMLRLRHPAGRASSAARLVRQK